MSTPAFLDMLADAETLLRYVAETRKDIDPATIGPVVMARSAEKNNTWNDETTIALIGALSRLSAIAYPVTAQTYRASANPSRTLHAYYWASACLVVVILVLSFFVSITGTLYDDISKDVDSANKLAASLRIQLGAPETVLATETSCMSGSAGPPWKPPNEALVVQDLQTFAADIRQLYNRALRLNSFLVSMEGDPFQRRVGEQDTAAGFRVRSYLQLQPELIDPRKEAFCKIYALEEVRDFAQNLQTDKVAWLGALSNYLLPVLYAWIGAMAYRLREVRDQLRNREYHPDYAAWARIVTAIIAGAIVSLFADFSKATPLSPLAIAFLVGFGVEIFFAFLDRLLVTFGQQASTSPAAKT